MEKYSLIPIVLFCLVFYGLTYLFTKFSILKTSVHRKIWNILLLITFLISALLGLLLVVQINYKLTIPQLETIMEWHVEFGIGMTVIAFFHIGWHLRYFRNILTKRNNKPKTKIQLQTKIAINEDNNGLLELKTRIAIFTLGFTTVISQIIILREFISVFYGNELIIGMFLSVWMVLTGFGAFIGKSVIRYKNIPVYFIVSFIISGIFPLLIIFLLNVLKNAIFPPGVMVNIFQVALSSVILLLPYCLISGYIFTLICRFVSGKSNYNRVNRIYALEAVGSLVGGVTCNFILIQLFDSFQSLIIVLFTNFIAAFFLSSEYRIFKYIIAATVILIPVFLWIPDINKIAKQSLFVNQELISHTETPYGSISVTESQKQSNIYENGLLLFSTGKENSGNSSVAENEEQVHYTMIQHDNPKKILIVSGGIQGVISEILKYNVSEIDYVEINPELIKTGRKYGTVFNSEKVHIINKDARWYIRQNKKKYDVVLINVPEPVSTSLNRYYTKEFFSEAKKIINPNGLISTSLMPTTNYISNEASGANSVLYNTLKSEFENILIIPGEKNYFLASDKELQIDVLQKIEKKSIETEYLAYYVDGFSLQNDSRQLMDNINPETTINKDLQPVSYYKQLHFWLTYFGLNYYLFIAVAFIILIIVISRLNFINLGMFAGGFTAASLEIIILMVIQILFGYVYQMIGIVVMIFMSGLAVGSFFYRRFTGSISLKKYILIQSVLGLFSIMTAFVLKFLVESNIGYYLSFIILSVLIFISALLVGIEFSFASKLPLQNTVKIASEIYSADLFGSAIGSLLIASFIVPLAGIINVGILCGIICLIIALFCLLKSKKNWL